MGWIIFWVACGLIAATIASGKGRNGAGWFFIGALLGPIGVILSLVASKDDEGLVKKGGQKKCNLCAELIKIDAKVCKHCGADQTSNSHLLLNVKPSHEALQEAIYKNDVVIVKALIDSGLEIKDNNLTISHLDYANMYKNDEIISLITAKLEETK